eukprot:scaffold34751_cov112-Isochrysis_galbana.AAC.1
MGNPNSGDPNTERRRVLGSSQDCQLHEEHRKQNTTCGTGDGRTETAGKHCGAVPAPNGGACFPHPSLALVMRARIMHPPASAPALDGP